jgi:hypothetical protein
VTEEPWHWHIDVVVYSHVLDGVLMEAIHVHDLVTNDPQLAESFAIDQTKHLNGPTRQQRRVEQMVMCHQEHPMLTLPQALMRRRAA